jgi:hypothetical protein
MTPWTIAHYGCPVLLRDEWQLWLFLFVPFIAASFGALAGQGSWLRIPLAALGAASRDLVGAALVHFGVLTGGNPDYMIDTGLMLAFFTAAGAGLAACIAPYRGKTLLLLSGIGGFLGQFVLLALIKHRPSKKEQKLLR